MEKTVEIEIGDRIFKRDDKKKMRDRTIINHQSPIKKKVETI